MIRVFIASPYTIGNPVDNVRKQIDYADELMKYGFAPYLPLLSHYQHVVHPRDYEDWMAITREYLLCCDCLLRLPGESLGADREVILALVYKIKVFHSIEDLCFYYELPKSK